MSAIRRCAEDAGDADSKRRKRQQITPCSFAGLVFVALGLLSACAFARAQSFQQPAYNVTLSGNSSPLSSAPINISSSGNNVVVAGQTGKVIHVYRMRWWRCRV